MPWIFSLADSRPRLFSKRSGSERADELQGQFEDGAEEIEDALHGEAEQAERQQDEPDDRVKNEQHQRERPAGNQKNDKQEKFHSSLLHRYGPRRLQVPARRSAEQIFERGAEVGLLVAVLDQDGRVY